MISIAVPELQNQLRPRITVFGVGGAGGNAVNNMIRSSLEGVEFVVANSDSQALTNNLSERKLQLGVNLTRGLGAGAKPEIGRASAEEQIDEIMAYLEGANMAFITAGMGGGTGTGAAPVIARAAREQGILTVGVVTKPFHFEGAHRMRMAEAGIAELQQYVDTLIVIPNQNLFRIANEKTTFADAFRLADEVLHSGVRGVTDLMVMPGLINLDFADIRSVMSEMGKAMMGTGEASGEKRSINAAESAIANPLLDDVSMKGARGVLINITGGYDMTLFEVDEAANRIREEVDADANIIFGSTFDEKMEGKMRVSVVATGIDAADSEVRRSGSPFGARAVSSPASAPAQKESTAARSTFAPAAQAPAAQPAASASPAAAQIQKPATTQSEQQPAFAAPFSWGLMGQKTAQAQAQAQQQAAAPSVPSAPAHHFTQPAQPTPSSQSPFATESSGALSHSAALQNLLERAKRAEAIAEEAEAAQQRLAAAQASAPQVPPQQMSMPITPPTSQPQQPSFLQQESGQPAAKKGGLFSRIAEGFGGGHAPKAQGEASPQTSAQPSKMGIDSGSRPQLSSEEETLEIPAFLRRQSN